MFAFKPTSPNIFGKRKFNLYQMLTKDSFHELKKDRNLLT